MFKKIVLLSCLALSTVNVKPGNDSLKPYLYFAAIPPVILIASTISHRKAVNKTWPFAKMKPLQRTTWTNRLLVARNCAGLATALEVGGIGALVYFFKDFKINF